MEEFLKPMGINQSVFAKRIDVSFPRLNEIIKGKRAVTPDTALRLERALGMSATFWLTLQVKWDAWQAAQEMPSQALETIEPLSGTVTDPTSGETYFVYLMTPNLPTGGGPMLVFRGPEDHHYVYHGQMPDRPLGLSAREKLRLLKKASRISWPDLQKSIAS